MRRIHIILFSISPVLLFVIAAALIWFAENQQNGVKFREGKYSFLQARGKIIDESAKLSPDANDSASALARVIITSDNVDRGYIQLLRGIAGVLSGLAGLQLLFIFVLAYQGRLTLRSSGTPQKRGAP